MITVVGAIFSWQDIWGPYTNDSGQQHAQSLCIISDAVCMLKNNADHRFTAHRTLAGRLGGVIIVRLRGKGEGYPNPNQPKS